MSRKLTRQAILIPIILLFLVIPGISPSLSWASQPIRTTQKTIVIDPGHGGMDPGISSSQGLTEKEAVLELARRIAKILDSRYNVLLTRITDTHLPPARRAGYANQNRADFFLSLHLHRRKSDQGTIFYFDGPAGNQPKRPGSWQDQPLSLQTESKKAAVLLAKIFQTGQTALQFSVVPAPVPVLEGTLMPAVVVEPFSISMLTAPGNQEVLLTRFAESISRGVDLYIKTQGRTPQSNK